jgi:hypothetical protein
MLFVFGLAVGLFLGMFLFQPTLRKAVCRGIIRSVNWVDATMSRLETKKQIKESK